MKAQTTHVIGSLGEAIASVYLQGKQMVLLDKNFSCRQGEIDLIFRDHNDIVFVEVKTRANLTKESGMNAIPYSKQKRISKAAQFYLQTHDFPGLFSTRFDIVLVSIHEEGKPTIIHIPNAFDPTEDTID